MTEPQEVQKKKPRYGIIISSTIMIILSLPLILLISIINANNSYPYPLDANKIGRLVGGVFGGFIFPAIFAFIIFAIKRYLMKRKNNTFILPFSITLLLVSIFSLVGAMGR